MRDVQIDIKCMSMFMRVLENNLASAKNSLQEYAQKQDEYYLKEAMADLFSVQSFVGSLKRVMLSDGVAAEDFLNDWLGDDAPVDGGGKALGTLQIPNEDV